MKTRFAAAEARCGPKQTNNNEGTAQDLQIQVKKERWAILTSEKMWDIGQEDQGRLALPQSGARIRRWFCSLVIGFFASLIVNVVVIILFANGKHSRFIQAFFSISDLLFHPGFEGGVIVVAGNVLLLTIPLTLAFAGLLKRYEA